MAPIIVDFFHTSWFNIKRYSKYLKAVARPVSRVFSLHCNWHGRVWTE